MKIRLDQFVIGSGRGLIALATEFSKVPQPYRYIVLNELGLGRVVEGNPEVTRAGQGYEVAMALAPSFPRKDGRSIGAGMCRNTGRMIRGMEVFRQHLESSLGAAIGELVFHPQLGSRISEYYKAYAGTSMFESFLKLELARMCSIPLEDKLGKKVATPLHWINSISKTEVSSDSMVGQRLRVRVGLDIEGVGYWEDDIGIFIHTDEQLEEVRKRKPLPHLEGLVSENPVERRRV